MTEISLLVNDWSYWYDVMRVNATCDVILAYLVNSSFRFELKRWGLSPKNDIKSHRRQRD